MVKQGITDMVRISDARMSGTAYGTVVLHTAPEAAAGGPLALVETATSSKSTSRRGACICTSATTSSHAAGRSGRRRRRTPREAGSSSYCETVQQADRGVDLDFLVGGSGALVGRESH